VSAGGKWGGVGLWDVADTSSKVCFKRILNFDLNDWKFKMISILFIYFFIILYIVS